LKRLFPGDHNLLAASQIDVALCLSRLGRSAEALMTVDAALDTLKRIFRGSDHNQIARCEMFRGTFLLQLRRMPEAIQAYEDSVAMGRRIESGFSYMFQTHLAFGLLVQGGRDSEAIAQLDEAIQQLEIVRSRALSLEDQTRSSYVGELTRDS